MMRNRKIENGYTMIEMLAVIALSGLVFLLLTQVFSMNMEYYANEYERTFVQQTAKNLHMDLSEEIKKANNVTVGCGGYCLTVDSDVYSIMGGQLLRNGEKLASVEIGNDVPFQDLGYIVARFDIVYKSAKIDFYLIAYERINAL